MSIKMFHLYDIPIRKIKWWERFFMKFAPTYITADVSMQETVFCKSKKLFGKLYYVSSWTETNLNRVNGLKMDFVFFDEQV